MSKRHSAKYKIDRAMGENLWGRSKSPVLRQGEALHETTVYRFCVRK